MTDPYRTTRLADLEGDDGWSAIRRALGVASFGINAWTAHEPGAAVISEHDEEPSGHEELYLVIAGHAEFTVGGERVDAPAGTIVFVPGPQTTRSATALEAGTTVLAVGGKPGEAYAPRAWELNQELVPLFGEGRHVEAERLLLDALDRYDDRASVHYNLACARAQLGKPGEALDSLRAAIAERPAFAAAASEDADLEPLRSHAEFAEIVRPA